MDAIVKGFKKFDSSLELVEKWFSGIGFLLITALVLAGVFLRTIFSFTFPWLEEFCQYLMVWIVCIGCVLSVKNNEHVGVDVIFSVLPKKFLKVYRTIIAIVCAAFLVFFTQFSLDLMLKVQKTGQASISMPWLQMYILYVGLVVGNVLLVYEYIKLFINLVKDLITGEKGNKMYKIKNEDIEGR